jgi:cytochrome c oxidase subunit 2
MRGNPPSRARSNPPTILRFLLLAGVLPLAACGSGTGISPIFPEPVSPNGKNIYDLYVLISVPAIAIFVLVEILLLVAILRFRRSRQGPGYVPPQTHGNTTLEVVWTVIPLGIVLFIAALSFVELQRDFTARTDQETQMNITVNGHQFGWDYTYEESGFTFKQEGSTTGEVPAMEVPTGKLVRLKMQSHDVIHSWWVPAISGKTDAVPGYDNYAWLKINQPGEWRGECAELCGAGHYTMQIRVKAVPQAEFDAWVSEQKAQAKPSPSPKPSPTKS